MHDSRWSTQVCKSGSNEHAIQQNTLTESTDLATLAAGLRYAAARFTPFEASLHTDDLRRDKAEALDAYLNEFRAMLDDSLDQYGEQQSKT